MSSAPMASSATCPSTTRLLTSSPVTSCSGRRPSASRSGEVRQPLTCLLAENTKYRLCAGDGLSGQFGREMNLREAVFIALRGLRVHRLRTVLTMLGIIIGVAAVILLVA